jgi:hypothetical protein
MSATGAGTTDPPPSSTNYHVQTDFSSSSSPSRRSQLFFGICDMRTACVALDVLNIGFTVIVVVVLTILFLVQGGPFVLANIVGTLISGIITAGISAVGLWGAMNWNMMALYAASIGFFFVFIWRAIHLDWVDIVVSLLLLYPHSMLSMEMRAGIMSPETFDREEYLTDSGRDFVEMAHNYISPKNENDG